MFVVSAFVSLVALASQAAAFQPRTPEHLAGLLANRAVDLVPRQSIDPSDFPSQCQSGCTSILTTIGKCTDTTCICTNSNVAAIQSCISCIVSTAPTAAVTSEGQTVINTFNTECSSAGVQSLSLGASGTASGSSASSTTVPAGAKSSAVVTSSLSMVGLVGAVVLGGVAAIL